MSANIGAIADAAARAVASMFIVLGVGVAFALAGKLDSEGLRAIGVTINWIFVPAILFDSFGQGLSWEALQTLWVVAIVGLLTAPISAIISYPAMVISRPPRWFREWFLFGATFQNTVALPLVLIQTICSQITVPKRDAAGAIMLDGNGTAVLMTHQECVTRGELYIFMYIFLHSLLFWVIAYDLMPSNKGSDMVIHLGPGVSGKPTDAEQRDDLVLEDGTVDRGSVELSSADNGFGTTTATSSVSSITIGPFPASHVEESYPSDVHPEGESGERLSASKTDSTPPTLHRSPPRLSQLAISNAYAAGSFYGGTAQMELLRLPVETNVEKNESALGKFKKRMIWLFFHIISLCSRPPIIAQLLGTFVGLIRPLQAAFFDNASVLRPVTLSIKIFAVASTAVTNLSMSGGLGLKIKESKMKHLFGGDPDGLSRRATFGFVFARMIVLPAALFGLTYVLQVAQLVPNDRLLMLVLYMQAMTPSANMCVVIPQILGNHQASGALSLLVLSQYIVALPSMLLWLSLSFYLTSDLV